jgi:hypothetical protein
LHCRPLGWQYNCHPNIETDGALRLFHYRESQGLG